ncbi:uncharacterized protein LOC105766887 [Gossypium raimondii]|uniref:uncharacterized protein LOC105766887 n=1 Tax=Gossypium raimondii TaxID=29730 RepID=UPI00063ABD54|nr:uncharacterized protein LOC105766887 [Gossypium raimondii]
MGPHRVFWRGLWKVRTLPKVRLFGWRLGHGILSTAKRCSIVARWSLPYEDEVKIIVDVVGNAKMSFAYCDAVVRGHEGMVIVRLTFLIAGAFDAHPTEALSLFCVAKKALEKSYSRVILEYDCAFVVNKFSSEPLDLSYYGRIVNEALVFCNSFGVVSFSFAHRSANLVAHYLAH